ncbi:MAG: hypothetical protein E7547_02190 [Ruminococcaceae bacterium]|nr:hypothetical protein [Oscillospiraceae bacterium]
MLAKITIWILTVLMPLVVGFNSVSVSVPFLENSAEIIYDFENEKAGSAAGTVTVNASLCGDYELYWGTEDNKKLSEEVGGYTVYYSEFATVDVDDGTGSADIQSFTAIPEGAETVLAYKLGVLAGTMEIPDAKVADYGKKIYSFGALSDVHFNRYNMSLSGDDACITFPNALNFFDNLGVSMVGISGDISADGERDAFEKYNTIASAHDFPVYTCTGNHDVSDYFSLQNWQELMNTGVYGAEKISGVESVSENGLDFVYVPQDGNGDAFVFLSQYQWDYNSPTSRILTDEQLNWLEVQFEKYKDKTVFLFFHTFLNNPIEGENPAMGEGNLENNKGHKYDLAFTDGCADEIRFKALLDKYENVVFFNGHSHWAYDMQKLNPNLNIADYGGEYATMVHVSSVSSPRRTEANLDDTTEHYMRSSEGMYVEVYENKIVFTACEFLKGEFLSYATYVIER